MALKKRNIPTITDLTNAYHYIKKDDLNGQLPAYEGRLVPIEFYATQDAAFISTFLDKCDHLFSKWEQGRRTIKLRGKYYPEEKLVLFLHNNRSQNPEASKNYYPQNAVMHINGNRLDNRIENLKETRHSRVAPAKSRNAREADAKARSIINSANQTTAQAQSQLQPQSQPRVLPTSDTLGISYLTTGNNAHMWRVVYVETKHEEVPVDADGKPLDPILGKTRGWHLRKTKIVTTRKSMLVGHYLTLTRAKRALRWHDNEVNYPLVRWQTDTKVQAICRWLRAKDGSAGAGANDAIDTDAVWAYIQGLYNRYLITTAEALDFMALFGMGHKALLDPPEEMPGRVGKREDIEWVE